MVAVLLLTLLSLAVATVADNTGLTTTAVGVMGTDTVTLPPLTKVAELLQLTSVPEVVQPKPLLVNVAGAVKPDGMLMVKVTGPVVGEVPPLAMMTGTVLVCEMTSAGEGCPIKMVRSGATTAGVIVVVAVLLAGLLSLAVDTVADNTGLVPAAAGRGVIVTCAVVLAPLVIIAELLQLTSVPEVAQLKPLLTKLAATVMLAGTLSVKLTGPTVGAVPILLRVMGIVLG